MSTRKITDKEREKKKRQDFITNVILTTIILVYVGMLVGSMSSREPDLTIIDIFSKIISFEDMSVFYKLFPASGAWISWLKWIGIALFADLCAFTWLWIEYDKTKGLATNPHGDAAFEENYLQYDKEFVINPKIVQKATGQKPKTYYTEEHKKVVTKPKITNQKQGSKYKDKVYRECWKDTQIYADGVALSLDGSWSQRNSNAMVFGASGAGKSRFFLSPNLLQANSNFLITDPAGEILSGFGKFLETQGYIVRCLNIAEMNKSCRFNPLYYIRKDSDIPIIVTTLMENTKKEQKSGGGDDFWQKTTQALLCAIIGYLFEVEPVERRNFYNVLQILRMAQAAESDEDAETPFDEMFKVLGEKNPNSYAFHQYQTYSLAPRKTANNILISTAVLISTYVDIEAFNNLTYKDEMELDKIGAAPFKLKKGTPYFAEDVDKYNQLISEGKIEKGYIDIEDTAKYEELIEKDNLGRYVEGKPYKVAIFLCIPTADATYNWITAMLYSIVFNLVYRRGETRQKQQVMNAPALAFPTRFLIDECANIGKIPNLQEYMATCRKYRISIVPIFQTFSQIVKVYGKEDANSMIGNCDTTLFLGGSDADTLKIVTDRLGKETIKILTDGRSNGGKSKSTSVNSQYLARELMSRVQVEQMNNSKCIVFIRAIKPFNAKKYPLEKHPNYKYTAEANPKEYSYVNPFKNEYNDDEIEAIRIKKCGEEGYVEPKEVDSARLRALKRERFAELKKSAIDLQERFHNLKKDDKDGYKDAIDSLLILLNEAKEQGATDALDIINETAKNNNIIIQDSAVQERVYDKNGEEVDPYVISNISSQVQTNQKAKENQDRSDSMKDTAIKSGTDQMFSDVQPDDVVIIDSYSSTSEYDDVQDGDMKDISSLFYKIFSPSPSSSPSSLEGSGNALHSFSSYSIPIGEDDEDEDESEDDDEDENEDGEENENEEYDEISFGIDDASIEDAINALDGDDQMEDDEEDDGDEIY